MARQPLTSRERVILLVGLVLIVVTVYGVLRLRPAYRSIASLAKEVADAEAEVRSFKVPRQPNREATQLLKQAEDLRAEVAKQREHLAGLEARFVGRDDTQAQADQKHQLSALADQHHVKILEVLPQDSSAYGKAFLISRKLLLSDPYERPVERWTVESDFKGLRGFLGGLNELPLRAIILEADVSIKVVPGYARGPQMLVTTLVLAL